MLVRWVTSSLRPHLQHIPRSRVRKLSPPYIFVAGVQLHAFTLSRLVRNSQKYTSLPPPFPPIDSGTETSASVDYTHAYKNFGDLQFTPVILNYSKNRGLAIRRVSVHTFFSISIFYEPFNNFITVWTHPIVNNGILCLSCWRCCLSEFKQRFHENKKPH